jgi:hypothetical protein
MEFPCPHCGCQDSYTDRSANEIKTIIPKELQKEFKEPPPPIQNSNKKSSENLKPPSSSEKVIFKSPPSSEEKVIEELFDKPEVIHKNSVVSSTNFSQIREPSTKTSSTTKELERTIINDVIHNHLDNLELNLKILDNNMKILLKNHAKFEGILLNIQKQIQRK